MSPEGRLRQRANIVLNMVMAFVVMILLAQLWLFTVILEAMENPQISQATGITAMICSMVGCSVIWILIRYFVRMEKISELDA